MEPYYHQPEHFLFEVPTSFSLPTIEPCPLKLELWHSRVIRAGVVFPADPNLPLSNHGCHFMGWVFWYSRVCLVSITGQQLNQWLNRFGSGFFKVHLFFLEVANVHLFTEQFVSINPFIRFLLMQYATSLLSITGHTLLPSPSPHPPCFIKTSSWKKVCNLRKQALMESKMGNPVEEMMCPVSLQLPEQTFLS